MDINETRGELIECSHRVHIAVVRDNTLLAYNNDCHKVIYARSSVKPIQALQCVKSGAYEKYNISQKELSLMCASHISEDFHVESTQSILDKANIGVEFLKCGIHIPENSYIYEKMIRENKKLSQLNNNCSGKHSGMLVSAKAKNEDLDTYLDINHSLQQRIIDDISHICEYDKEKIIIGRDGCGAPVHALPIYNLALGFSKLSDNNKLKDKRQEIEIIIDAMTTYPEMVSGTDTFCTDLMKVFKGRIFGKYGTQGVYLLGDRKSNIGICIKVEDGHKASIFCAVVETLKQLNLIDEVELKKLEKYHNPKLFNSRDEVIGEMKSNFNLNFI
ncbi:MAG: asparaginase [Peptostreptococcaceae bacterium]